MNGGHYSSSSYHSVMETETSTTMQSGWKTTRDKCNITDNYIWGSGSISCAVWSDAGTFGLRHNFLCVAVLFTWISLVWQCHAAWPFDLSHSDTEHVWIPCGGGEKTTQRQRNRKDVWQNKSIPGEHEHMQKIRRVHGDLKIKSIFTVWN